MDYETIRYAATGGIATLTLDRPERLKALGQSLNASFHSWTFLTGEPAEVRSLLDQLLAPAAAAEKASDPRNLAKEGLVVLIDPRGQIRAVHRLTEGTALTDVVKETAVLINTRPPTN